MRYPACEKLEIVRLVEQSHLPVKRTLQKLGIASVAVVLVTLLAHLIGLGAQVLGICLGELLLPLRMQLRCLGVAIRLNFQALVVERPGRLLDRLPLSLSVRVRMKRMSYRQLCDRPLSRKCLN